MCGELEIIRLESSAVKWCTGNDDGGNGGVVDTGPVIEAVDGDVVILCEAGPIDDVGVTECRLDIDS